MVSETWTPIFQPASARCPTRPHRVAARRLAGQESAVSRGAILHSRRGRGALRSPCQSRRYLRQQSLGIGAGIPRGGSESRTSSPTSKMGRHLHRHGRALPLFRWPPHSPETREIGLLQADNLRRDGIPQGFFSLVLSSLVSPPTENSPPASNSSDSDPPAHKEYTCHPATPRNHRPRPNPHCASGKQ